MKHFSSYLSVKIFWVIALLICCLPLACKKDIAIPEPEVVYNGSSSLINIGDTIEIGNPVNMFIVKYSDTVRPPGFKSDKEQEFDVDKDGVNDFQIYVTMFYSLGNGPLFYSSITSLNNTSLNGYYRNDTAFIHIDSTITTDTTPPTFVNIILHQTFTYKKIDSNDKIDGVAQNVFKIFARNFHDIITKAMVFQSDAIRFNQSPNGTSIGMTSVSNDTLQTLYYHHSNNQFTFPMGSNYYIGIKQNIGSGIEKLGWIKLNCLSSNQVAIVETAIQK